MERPYLARLLELVTAIDRLPGYHVESTIPSPFNAEYGKVTLMIVIRERPRKGVRHGKAKRRKA